MDCRLGIKFQVQPASRGSERLIFCRDCNMSFSVIKSVPLAPHLPPCRTTQPRSGSCPCTSCLAFTTVISLRDTELEHEWPAPRTRGPGERDGREMREQGGKEFDRNDLTGGERAGGQRLRSRSPLGGCPLILRFSTRCAVPGTDITRQRRLEMAGNTSDQLPSCSL